MEMADSPLHTMEGRFAHRSPAGEEAAFPFQQPWIWVLQTDPGREVAKGGRFFQDVLFPPLPRGDCFSGV